MDGHLGYQVESHDPIFAYCLRVPADANGLKPRTFMKGLFSKLEKSLHTIGVGDVMQKMGYPPNWENVIKLAK